MSDILPIQGNPKKPCPTCPYPFGIIVNEGEGATTGIVPYEPPKMLQTAGPLPKMQLSAPLVFGGDFEAADRPLPKELASFSN